MKAEDEPLTDLEEYRKVFFEYLEENQPSGLPEVRSTKLNQPNQTNQTSID